MPAIPDLQMVPALKNRRHDCFYVVFGMDSFWEEIDNIKFIGMLRRVFKNEEIDHTFAVRHTPSASSLVINKAWAKRWLGLSPSWLSKIQRLTLEMGLKIANDHGGLAKTKSRALIQQKKDEDLRTARKLKYDEKIKKKQDEDDLFEAILNWRGETSDVPREFYYGSVQYMRVIREFQTFDKITNQLIAIYQNEAAELENEKQKWAAIQFLREETKRALDERLNAEKLPCIGEFYNNCIHAGEGVTDAMIAEIRFCNAIWNNRAYDGIVQNLALHGFYRGIHAHARIIFRRRFHIDENGLVGEENTAYTQMTQDIRYFRNLGTNSDSEQSDDDME